MSGYDFSGPAFPIPDGAYNHGRKGMSRRFYAACAAIKNPELVTGRCTVDDLRRWWGTDEAAASRAPADIAGMQALDVADALLAAEAEGGWDG